MNNKFVISVRISVCITREFTFTISLFEGSSLNPYLFSLVMDDLVKVIQENVPGCVFCRQYSFSR